MKFTRLAKGEKVAVICPSSPIKPENIEKSRKQLEEQGYEVLLGESLYWNKGGFMAGEAQKRVKEIHDLFARDDVRGIFCARGGDSSLELLQHLDREIIRNNPKVFLGYSDITNLHIYLNQECDLITFHGPMVHSDMLDGLDDYSKVSLEKAIKGEKYLFENPCGDPLILLRKGEARGRLIGGNLTLITAGLGGPYEIDTQEKILFLEDVNESAEHLHRMLWQLSYGGKFDKIQGVILGDFKNCDNCHDPSYDQDVIFREFFKNFQVPVLMHLRSGHCRPMATLPLGAIVHLKDDNLQIFA